MLDALEKISRRPINASDATHGGRYICPECHKPVDLRFGDVRTPYFAHAKGVSNEDCALYAAQLGASGQMVHAGPNEDTQASMRLILKLARNGKTYSWGLELDVPTLRESQGSISIDVGGRINEVKLDANTSAFRTIPVEPQAEPYTIVSTAPPLGRLSQIEKSCSSLAPTFGTVFGDILRLGHGSVRLAQELQTERTYAVVWKEGLACQLPEELGVEPLESRQGWSAALIHIPHEPSQSCWDWLVQFTRLKIAPVSPALVPAWPPVLRPVTTGVVEAPDVPAVYLYGYHGPENQPLALFARNHNSEKIAQGYSDNPPFFRLTPESSANVHLTCRKTDGLELDIDFSMGSVPLIRGNVVTLMGKLNDGTNCAADLHSNATGTWLQAVRTGEIKFLSLSFPPGTSGRVRCGSGVSWTNEVNIAESKVGSISLDSLITEHAATAETIREWLRDKTLNVLFDFGGFGRAQMGASEAPRCHNPERTSDELTEKIKNHFLQFPRSVALPKGWESLPMKQLVRQLQKAKPCKQALIHYRILVSQVIRESNGD